MGENSKIEWTDHTFNPWRGCTKVSEGCKHCYAETLSKRNPAQLGQWGAGKPRVVASEEMWRKPLKWNAEASGADVRPRVFCASLADWLDDDGVPAGVLARLLELIYATPNLDWLLLTKRPQNWRGRLEDAWRAIHNSHHKVSALWLSKWLDGEPPHNVWLGVTCENQERANERIPVLLSIPAKVRFLSCEPLLGPVDLRSVPGPSANVASPEDGNALFIGDNGGVDFSWSPRGMLHWVIVGGESGPGARPMHPDWARSLRGQCADAGVPFLFKQWGEWTTEIHRRSFPEDRPLICVKPYGEVSWFAGDEDTCINCSENYRETDVAIERVGKKAAGRLLDGVEHNGFPQVR